MTETLRKLAGRINVFKESRTSGNKLKLKISKIEGLDLTRKPSDRLPHRFVSEFQLQDAVGHLNSFLSIDSDGITSLHEINNNLVGVGDQMRTLIDKYGRSEFLGSDKASTRVIRLPVNKDEVFAFAQNDRVVVLSNLGERGETKYAVYMPRVGRLHEHAGDGNYGLYFAIDYSNGASYRPQKNPRDLMHSKGYFNAIQNAVHDVLLATNLLA